MFLQDYLQFNLVVKVTYFGALQPISPGLFQSLFVFCISPPKETWHFVFSDILQSPVGFRFAHNLCN